LFCVVSGNDNAGYYSILFYSRNIDRRYFNRNVFFAAIRHKGSQKWRYFILDNTDTKLDGLCSAMDLRVTNKVLVDSRKDIAQYIHSKSSLEPNLTVRELSTIVSLMGSGGIVAAYDGEVLVGWLVAEPLTKSVKELGMAYVEPKSRDQGVFNRMVQFASKDTNWNYICATYSILVSKKFISNGFEHTSLFNLCLVSRFKFVLKRLKRNVISKIARRVSENEVYFMIKKAK
jgi:hypothetical protein